MIVPCLATVSLFIAFIAAPAFASPPAEIKLTGVVRDFRASSDPGGHPAMERGNKPAGLGPKWVTGNLVEPVLGGDRKPVFTNDGIIVMTAWKDAADLTALTALRIADQVDGGRAEPGTHNPAQIFGSNFITTFDGCAITDIS